MRVLLLALVLAGSAACSSSSASSDPVAVTFLGDSWTAGYRASTGGGFPGRTAERLGWQATVLGYPGAGYVQAGDGGPFGRRIDEAVAGAPDVIVVQGSLNDAGTEPTEVDLAAHVTLSRLRDAADPATRIVVLGAPLAPGTDRPVIEEINRVLADAAQEAGVLFVDMAAQEWIDPDDPDLWADPIHPDDAGHALIAERLADLLEGVVQR